jgi:hypothetical protein
MKKRIAKYVALILLVSALAAAPAAPAAAHTGSCTVTGNTWHDGTINITVYGSGNVDCTTVHSLMYIKVTLEEYVGNWLARSSAEKGPIGPQSSIYKQTSWSFTWGNPGGYCTYRVRIFYKVWNNGSLNHSETVYRGQQQHPCNN